MISTRLSLYNDITYKLINTSTLTFILTHTPIYINMTHGMCLIYVCRELFSVHIKHCTVYNVNYTLYSIQYNVHCTLYNKVDCKLYTV